MTSIDWECINKIHSLRRGAHRAGRRKRMEGSWGGKQGVRLAVFWRWSSCCGLARQPASQWCGTWSKGTCRRSTSSLGSR